ncbi:hypothetical protein PSD17_10090 [Pseudonocardia sp. D17]|nr:hypothetical protein PSD17_10090 [Pseudonocardia sp. D17]
MSLLLREGRKVHPHRHRWITAPDGGVGAVEHVWRASLLVEHVFEYDVRLDAAPVEKLSA